MSSRILHLSTLNKLHACREPREKFEELFGKKVKLNKKNALHFFGAMEVMGYFCSTFYWAKERLLSNEQRKFFYKNIGGEDHYGESNSEEKVKSFVKAFNRKKNGKKRR